MTDPCVHRVEIDGADPMAAGAQVADQAVTPVMRYLERDMTPRQRAQLWTGLFASTLGMMTAAIGPDDAEAVYIGLRGAFDEARGIQALQVANPSTGGH